MLSACSAVPISTMIQMAGFGKDDMLRLKPEDIRARITVNDSIQVKAEKTKLTAGFETDGQQQQLTFNLEEIKREPIAAVDGFFSSRPAFQKVTFKLSSEGIAAFNKAKQLAQTEQDGKASFSVSAAFDKKDGSEIQTDEKLLLTLELKLDKDSDFMTLIDEWQVKTTGD